MLNGQIVLQSAGSMSIAILSLILTGLQAFIYLKHRRCTWYGWSAAVSFLTFIYSISIFFEYNNPPGEMNRLAGIMEYVAIIAQVHCLCGFSFSFLGLRTRWYHPVAGTIHVLIILMLFNTDYFVADTFVTRSFSGLSAPYVEADLGPMGPVFVIFALLEAIYAMMLWVMQSGIDPVLRRIYLIGMFFWLLLGGHDALASLGVPTVQYVMEYGFLGFALFVFWVVFSGHLKLKEKEKYQTIAEYANDSIMVIQDGQVVFGNPSCAVLLGRPLSTLGGHDLLAAVAPEDRERILDNYNRLLTGECVPEQLSAHVCRMDGERRFVEIASSVIQYLGRPAVLAIVRDMTERKRVEQEREFLIADLKKALNQVRSLSGLLPICCECKKIRDDKGYWNRIEEYIEEHSEVDFTHSICPECSKKLYNI